MIVQIAAIIAPLFICAGIGFFWQRWGPTFDTRGVTNLSLVVGMPCLTFSALTELHISPAAFVEMAGAYMIALICFMAVGFVVLRVSRLPSNTYLPIFTAANTGNMGLPLALFAFGEPGLSLAICVYVLSSVFSFTVGWSIYAGRMGLDVLTNNPLIYAVAAALFFMIAGIDPPAWVANTTRILGGLTIPLMIISLGVSMAQLEYKTAWRTVGLSIVKLVTGFAIGLAIAEALGLTGAARGVLIVSSAMPIAVHNYAFARRFDRRPEETASLIILSTLISLATLPALMWFVL